MGLGAQSPQENRAGVQLGRKSGNRQRGRAGLPGEEERLASTAPSSQSPIVTEGEPCVCSAWWDGGTVWGGSLLQGPWAPGTECSLGR